MINDKLVKDLQEQIDNIIDSGSNYIKYKDGTMIIYGEKTFNTISVIGYGSLYRSVSVPYDDYPIEFKSIPIVSYSIKSLSPNANSAVISVLHPSTKTNAGNVCIIKENNSQISGTVSYIAIGKWK